MTEMAEKKGKLKITLEVEVNEELMDLAKDAIKPLFHGPASDESGWVVLDYVSVIVHIFYKPVREFYALEKLWADAKKIRIPAKLSKNKD